MPIIPLVRKAKLEDKGVGNESDIAQNLRRDYVGRNSGHRWLRGSQRRPHGRYSRLLPEQAVMLPIAGMLQGRQPWGAVSDASTRLTGIRRTNIGRADIRRWHRLPLPV